MEAEAQGARLARAEHEGMVGSDLGADLGRIDRLRAATDDGGVERVFHVRGGILRSEKRLGIRLILREQQRHGRAIRRRFDLPEHAVEGGVVAAHPPGRDFPQARLDLAAFVVAAPGPGVAKPQRWQHVQRRGLRTAVGHHNPDAHVVGTGLGVLDLDVKKAVFGKHPGVGQLILRIIPRPATVLRAERFVGKPGLRILVKRPVPGVGRRRIEIEVHLFHILPVVALGAGQAEEAFLQKGIATVPKRDRETEAALAVGESEQAILAPPIGPAAGLFVIEITPRVAVRRVILAHRAPLSFGQVRTPAFPVVGSRLVFGQADAFGVGGAGRE
jgi:hypothetical protein